jgi:hypothetical protein
VRLRRWVDGGRRLDGAAGHHRRHAARDADDDFLILALACFSRASPRLEHWLLHHPRFGAPLRQWREHRAVSRRGKAMACLGMAIGFIAMCLGIRRGGSSSWWAAWNWPSSSTCCAARKARKAGQNLPPIAEITGSKRPLPRQENPN